MQGTILFALTAMLFAWPREAGAANASATVTVTATFGSRTSLEVSTKVLHFDVTDPEQPATASVDFAARARTAAGNEVVLSVETLRALQVRGGAADVDSSLTFDGDGEGTLEGPVRPAVSTIAGRWTGSGRRNGRLVFALRGSAPGSYSLPVRFVLSTP